MVKRKTQAKRLVRKLKAIRDEMQRRMHAPVREQHRWLRQVLTGHYQYFGVIFNYRSLRLFKECVVRYWRKTLGNRSQKGRMNWATYRQLLTAFPPPGTGDPPGMAAMIDSPRVLSEEPTAVTPHGGICGGESQQWLSYPTKPQAGICAGGSEKSLALPRQIAYKNASLAGSRSTPDADPTFARVFTATSKTRLCSGATGR